MPVTNHNQSAAWAVSPTPPPWRQWVTELWWLLNFADFLLVGSVVVAVRAARAIPNQVRWPLAAAVLVALLAFKAGVAYVADPRPLQVVLLAPVVVVVGFALFCAWVMSGLAPTRIKGAHGASLSVRSTVTGKAKMTAHYAPSPTKPGAPTKTHTPWFTAKHEGGHAAAAHGVGGRALEAHAYADGSGWCSAVLPGGGSQRDRVIRYVAFIAGGEVAVNSQAGCGHDQRMIKWATSLLPSAEQARARHEGYAKARSAQTSYASVRNAVATSLVRTGRWGGGGSGTYHL